MSLQVVPRAEVVQFDDRKLQLLKDTLCKGASDDEFQLFAHACKRTGLDPFMRQIQPVKRWDSTLNREAMTIQVGIDGYRLIADRTGRYAPGRETVYTYDDRKNLIAATAYCKKQTADGTWHEVSSTAFYNEYVALKKDKTPTMMWASKPHIMLGKCAEALCLRKAFPAELSGVYTSEEMEQASNPVDKKLPTIQEPILTVTKDQAQELQMLLENCSVDYQTKVLRSLPTMKPSIETLDQLPVTFYQRFKDRFMAESVNYQESLKVPTEVSVNE